MIILEINLFNLNQKNNKKTFTDILHNLVRSIQLQKVNTKIDYLSIFFLNSKLSVEITQPIKAIRSNE